MTKSQDGKNFLERGFIHQGDDLWLGLKKTREEEHVLLPPCSQTTLVCRKSRTSDDHREEGSPPKREGWNFQPPATPVGQIQLWLCPAAPALLDVHPAGLSSKQRLWTSAMFSDAWAAAGMQLANLLDRWTSA